MDKNLILLAECKVIQSGLKSVIESSSSWNVFFTAFTKEDLLSTFQNNNSLLSVSVAIINIKCVDDDVFGLVNILKDRNPEIKCIIYANRLTYGDIIYSSGKGIDGFLSIDAGDSELLLALESVYQGKTYIQQDLMKEILLISNRLSFLTSRERQIYDMVCDGSDKQEICLKLDISVRTCENYFSQLYSKLGVNSLFEMQEIFGFSRKRNKKLLKLEAASSAFNIPSKNLTLVQDIFYDEDGVKILYKNIPVKASVLEVMLHKGTKI